MKPYRLRVWALTGVWAIAAVTGCTAGRSVAPAAPPVTQLLERIDAAAAQGLWPGFDTRRIPVAIYDGTHTWLHRHPSPPAEMTPVGGTDSYRMPGRHAEVTANSSALIGDRLTATVLLDGTGRVDDLAALVVHEMFHVFQRERHPAWVTDESQLFLYPATDARVLAEVHEEMAAFHRALVAEQSEAACWARAALQARRKRYALLEPGAAAYERGSERNEGLATYLQHEVAQTPDARIITTAAPSGTVRERAYVTGPALGRLLDRLRPEWKTVMESNDSASLDELLLESIRDEAICAFTLEEEAKMRADAAVDAAAVQKRRTDRRREMMAAAGWRVIVEPPEPMMPAGFDPLNVELTAPGEILHSRYLKLASKKINVEMIGLKALTQSAGDHPLWVGAKRVEITGIAAPPSMSGSRVEAPGLKIDAPERPIDVDEAKKTIVIR